MNNNNSNTTNPTSTTKSQSTTINSTTTSSSNHVRVQQHQQQQHPKRQQNVRNQHHHQEQSGYRSSTTTTTTATSTAVQQRNNNNKISLTNQANVKNNTRYNNPPYSQSQSQQQPNRHNKNYNTHNNNRYGYKNNKTPVKKNHRFFALHTSPDYTFVVSRIDGSISVTGGNGGNGGSAGSSDGAIASTNNTSSASSVGAISNTNQQHHQYTFSGSDTPVLWQNVRIVRYLSKSMLHNTVSTTTTTTTTEHPDDTICPICLDVYRCPRITKCGHTFCLGCLVHYFYSVTSTTGSTNTSSRNTTTTATSQSSTGSTKCPCCSVPICLSDVKPVQIISVMNLIDTNGTSTTAATAVPGKPVVSSSSSSSSTTATSQTIQFIKLHRNKNCCTPYLPYWNEPKRYHPNTLPCSSDTDAKFSRFTYLDCDDYNILLQSNIIELQDDIQEQQQLKGGDNMTLFYSTLAMEMVQKELYSAQMEATKERELHIQYTNPLSGMYSPQDESCFYYPEEEKEEQLQLQQQHRNDNANGNNNESAVFSENNEFVDEIAPPPSSPLVQPSSPLSDRKIRARSCSTCSYNSATSRISRGNTNNKNYGGTIFLDPHENEFVFYQIDDGSLCFLSPFNMRCLQDEFSVYPPNSTESIVTTTTSASSSHRHWEDEHDNISTVTNNNTDTEPQVQKSVPSIADANKYRPLPDRIDGKVVEIEKVYLTPDVRERYRFLSHLPYYTTVTFVEINIGYLLSAATKKKYKAEFYKRRQRRLQKLSIEQKQDLLRQQQEEQTIQERKARYQSIDPEDDFFHPVPRTTDPLILSGDEFGPVLGSPVPASSMTLSLMVEPTATTDDAATTIPVPVSNRVASVGNAQQKYGAAPKKPMPSFSSVASRPTITTSKGTTKPVIVFDDSDFPTLGAPSSSTSNATTTTTNSSRTTKPATHVAPTKPVVPWTTTKLPTTTLIKLQPLAKTTTATSLVGTTKAKFQK